MSTSGRTDQSLSTHGRGAVTSLRVTLVEDHSLFAEALAITLGMEGYDAQRIVPDATVGPATRLLPTIVRTRAGAVLLDLDLGPCGDAVPLIKPLTLAGMSVIVVTGSADRARWGECVAAGARKVISKSAPLTEIMSTVGRLANGLPVMGAEEKNDLLATWREHQSVERDVTARLDLLTRREAEVLGLLMQGKQVSEIARDRFVSESTVRTQVKSVLAKLQVGSQLTAVGLAHRSNWRAPGDSSTLVM